MFGQLMIHAGGEFGDIGEPDAKRPQRGIFAGGEQARRQADLIKRAPEFVLGVRVIGLLQRRLSSGRGAAEHQLKARLQPLGQHMFPDGTFHVCTISRTCCPICGQHDYLLRANVAGTKLSSMFCAGKMLAYFLRCWVGLRASCVPESDETIP